MIGWIKLMNLSLLTENTSTPNDLIMQIAP